MGDHHREREPFQLSGLFTLPKVETGVPREILVAIWGRESQLGRVRPKHHALRLLVTQAFSGPWRTLYYLELLAALLILEQD